MFGGLAVASASGRHGTAHIRQYSCPLVSSSTPTILPETNNFFGRCWSSRMSNKMKRKSKAFSFPGSRNQLASVERLLISMTSAFRKCNLLLELVRKELVGESIAYPQCRLQRASFPYDQLLWHSRRFVLLEGRRVLVREPSDRPRLDHEITVDPDIALFWE
jgi:hypothetical protein